MDVNIIKMSYEAGVKQMGSGEMGFKFLNKNFHFFGNYTKNNVFFYVKVIWSKVQLGPKFFSKNFDFLSLILNIA